MSVWDFSHKIQISTWHQSGFSGHCSSPLSNFPAKPGLGAPWGARPNPASRVARRSSTRHHNRASFPAREGHAPPSYCRNLARPTPVASSASLEYGSTLGFRFWPLGTCQPRVSSFFSISVSSFWPEMAASGPVEPPLSLMQNSTGKTTYLGQLQWSCDFLAKDIMTTWKRELVLSQTTRKLSGKNLIFNCVLCYENLWSRMFWKSLDHSKHVAPVGRRPKRYLQTTFKASLMQPRKLLLSNKPTMIWLHT